jgi:hypothetical protein
MAMRPPPPPVEDADVLPSAPFARMTPVDAPPNVRQVMKTDPPDPPPPQATEVPPLAEIDPLTVTWPVASIWIDPPPSPPARVVSLGAPPPELPACTGALVLPYVVPPLPPPPAPPCPAPPRLYSPRPGPRPAELRTPM